MTKLLFVIGLLLSLTKSSFCQDDEYLEFQDTIPFYRPKVDTLKSLEGFGSEKLVIDTLGNSSVLFLQVNVAKFSNKNLIAVKRGNYFLIFPILAEGTLREIFTEKISLSNGGDMLLIKYAKSSGISQEGHGWAEYTKGFEIWELDEISCLASFVNYYSHLEWDSDNNDGSSNICENYSFTIKDSTIKLTEQNNCNEFDERLKKLTANIKKITYRLTKDGAIKIK